MKALYSDIHGSIKDAVVGSLYDLAVTMYMVVAAENAGNVKGLPTHFYTPL